MSVKKPSWIERLIVSVIERHLFEAGFGPDDLVELKALVMERRRLQQESRESANRFLNKLKELNGN